MGAAVNFPSGIRMAIEVERYYLSRLRYAMGLLAARRGGYLPVPDILRRIHEKESAAGGQLRRLGWPS